MQSYASKRSVKTVSITKLTNDQIEMSHSFCHFQKVEELVTSLFTKVMESTFNHKNFKH